MTTVKTVTFGSIEEVKAFLATNTDIPEDVKEAMLAEITEAIAEEENTDTCDCPACKLNAIIDQLEELQEKSNQLKLDVESDKVNFIEALGLALEYANQSEKLHAEGSKLKELIDAEEEEEPTAEEKNSEYLEGVVHQTLSFLKDKGVAPKGNAYKGMVSATAMTIAALDDLGFIVKK